jgi:guanosine-3',5'-bis(diphosphate) 3'-pyrophosphohydrolase
MNNKSSIPLAREYALKAHGGMMVTTISGFQRPQILHLQEVADLVWASGGTDDEIAAAWLHDIVEDTAITAEDLLNNFNSNISEIVKGLTDLDEYSGLSLSERKQKQAERLRNENESVRRVKIADQTSNIHSLIDPIGDMTLEEWDNYLEGARLIAAECQGISPLLDQIFLDTYNTGKELVRSRF